MTDLFAPETIERVTRQTSIDAMRSVEGRAPNLRTRIWLALDAHGHHTADETAAIIDENILSVRPQFTLLTKENKIYDTGERRPNASGREAIVWGANPPSMWRKEPEHLTPAERIAKLETRVAYLEMLLTKEGIEYD